MLRNGGMAGFGCVVAMFSIRIGFIPFLVELPANIRKGSKAICLQFATDELRRHWFHGA
jgi:hypothetical protein